MQYDWGRSDADSFISQLLKKGSFPLQAFSGPIAELWMGDYPNMSSWIQMNGKRMLLQEAVSSDHHYFLGESLAQKRINRLPFLLKILDAERPLSLQAHPNQKLAKTLHQNSPENYPDSFSKPELAVSIKKTKLLAGFRSRDELRDSFSNIPELSQLCRCSKEEIHDPNQLPKAFSSLIYSNSEDVEKAVCSHIKNLGEENFSRKNWKEQGNLDSHLLPQDKCFFALIKHYGDKDPGVFCPYFLNYIELEPEDAIFLEPNCPHTCLEGTFLECSTASNNTVRGALTSKFRDTKVFLKMLNYKSIKPKKLRPILNLSPLFYKYETPLASFELQLFRDLPEEGLENSSLPRPVTFSFSSLGMPSILFVLSGTATIFFSQESTIKEGEANSKQEFPVQKKLSQGDAFFLPGGLDSTKAVETIRATKSFNDKEVLKVSLAISKDARVYRAIAQDPS